MPNSGDSVEVAAENTPENSPKNTPENSAENAAVSAAELATLASSWASGELRPHVERVLAFVGRHRSEILRMAEGARDADLLMLTTKRVIMQAGTVHTLSEMRDQIREIEDEIWIRGERGDYDRENIAHQWTSAHAANWRRWRVKEYLYVADRCDGDILARLRG